MRNSAKIHVKLYRGVRDHFRQRLMEWVMLWPTFLLYLAMRFDASMFEKSPSFAYLAYWADQQTWAFMLSLYMLARLAALTVNGTFKRFALSPHFRAGASLFGVAVWSQISLGFTMAFLNAGGAMSGVAAWSTLVIMELVNTARSWADVGKNAAERG